ncbi:MAG: molecular chaperone TorD family protein [Rhodospirillales bacterium]|nr:molecular chaperone TorD family protein [Rhodospirillales bacterium]
MTPEELADRADLYAILSAALQPPIEAARQSALIEALADDLEELNARLGYGVDRAVADLRAALTFCQGPDLLVEYSSLFLSPPIPAALNASVHLDRALMGESLWAMEAWYRRRGVERAADFKDHADHLAVQLDFVAHLLRLALGTEGTTPALPPDIALAEIGDFLARYVRPWMGGLLLGIRQGMAERGVGPTYKILVDFLVQVVEADAARLGSDGATAAIESKRHADPKVVIGADADAAHCRLCGKPYIRDKVLRKMVRLLKEKGLGIEHLDTCPDCRDNALGVTRKTPPALKRSARPHA